MLIIQHINYNYNSINGVIIYKQNYKNNSIKFGILILPKDVQIKNFQKNSDFQNPKNFRCFGVKSWGIWKGFENREILKFFNFLIFPVSYEIFSHHKWSEKYNHLCVIWQHRNFQDFSGNLEILIRQFETRVSKCLIKWQHKR